MKKRRVVKAWGILVDRWPDWTLRPVAFKLKREAVEGAILNDKIVPVEIREMKQLVVIGAWKKKPYSKKTWGPVKS